jgi:hypothetical protein
MDAPFGIAGRLGEGDVEILAAAKRSGRCSRDDLVEISIFREVPEPFACGMTRGDLQRGTEMNLANADARFLKRCGNVGGLLVFDGEMAGAAVHPKKCVKPLIARTIR